MEKIDSLSRIIEKKITAEILKEAEETAAQLRKDNKITFKATYTDKEGKEYEVNVAMIPYDKVKVKML